MEKLAIVQGELLDMYRRAFMELGRLLPAGGRMVAGIPFWTHVLKAEAGLANKEKRTQETHLPIDRIIKNAGFTLEQTLLYRRPQSVVGREILVLKKK